MAGLRAEATSPLTGFLNEI